MSFADCGGNTGIKKEGVHSIRTAFDIVRADAVKNVYIALNGKRKTVGFRETCLPDIASAWIALATHLFHAERRMARHREEKPQRFIKLFLESLGQLPVLTREAMREKRPHTLAVFSSRMASSTVSKGPSIRPAFKSSNASRIIFCQRGV